MLGVLGLGVPNLHPFLQYITCIGLSWSSGLATFEFTHKLQKSCSIRPWLPVRVKEGSGPKKTVSCDDH